MQESRRRILIVDDNAEIHEDFKKMLLTGRVKKDSETKELEKELFGAAGKEPQEDVSLSYDIDDAYQGEEAIAMVDRAAAEGRPYALAFMDVRMPPGMDGITTIEKIWEKHPTMEMVICTAFSDYSWNQMLEKLGHTDHLLFIKKPFDGVAVKQIALTLTTKWDLDCKNREHLKNLESEVEKRTAQIKNMMLHLSDLKNKAEAATRAKSEFLSNMSHEIRTPMNAVIGFGELLKSTTLTEQQKDYVNTICTSGELLIALINDILDIAKIESGKVVLEEIDFDMEYLITSILKILRTRTGGKNIDLNLVYPEGIPRHFKGDPTRLRQIFINLVGNAVKFTDQGEVTVRIKLEDADLTSVASIAKLKFFVKDTGIGIPREKQNEIFEAFTQADSSVTRKYSGTGLGLTITRSLLTMMGSNIAVQSEPGKGAEFFFTLDLKLGQPTVEKDIILVNLEALKGKKALVVDDNEQSREILTSYCTLIKMVVAYSTSSGKNALAWLEKGEQDIDCILSDIMMPGMDGYTFAGKVKENLRLNNVKLIALTSDAIPGIADQTSKAGFDAFLSKPFTRTELYEILRAVFGDTRKEKHQIITRHMAHELLAKGISVLIVEDNALNQKLMSILLQQMGCIFEIANNGREAVTKVGENIYDVILMDIQMPVMDGLEASKIIRGRLGIKTPIIALTAHVFKEDEEKCKVAGMDDFLTKPVVTNALKEKILKWGKK
jgi:signal transduction histidine kinase/AmiR/NasT family two-component response regulator